MCSNPHLKRNTFSHIYVACLQCGSYAPVHSCLTTPVLMRNLCSDHSKVGDILTTYQLFHNLAQQKDV